MRIDLLTLFPNMFDGVFAESIVKRACDKKLVEIVLTNIRDFARDKHRSVDDRPYGGGPGMVMMCQPVFDAVESVLKDGPAADEIILLTPQGETLNQQTAREFAETQRLLLLAGHYEGFDERIRARLATREISIGDYVLSGGEIPAMVVIDTLVRLIPGVLGDSQSMEEESFTENLLEYPQYTRPENYKDMKVPDVLLSGNHQKIRTWRQEQSLLRTRSRRPDLKKN